jgi:hypothetical protein
VGRGFDFGCGAFLFLIFGVALVWWVLLLVAAMSAIISYLGLHLEYSTMQMFFSSSSSATPTLVGFLGVLGSVDFPVWGWGVCMCLAPPWPILHVVRSSCMAGCSMTTELLR